MPNLSPLPSKPPCPSPPARRWTRGLLLLLALALLGGVYLLFDPAGGGLFPSCLLLRVTGYRCPGCGLQRALHALLHGQVRQALAYNYALLVVLPLALLAGYRYLFPERTMGLERWMKQPRFLGALIVLTLLWWVVRNCFGW